MKIRCLYALIVSFFLFPLSADNGWSSANAQRNNRSDFSQVRWHENFDSKENSFTVEYCEGAAGKVEIVPGGGKNNSPALRTVKTNNEGYIVIRFKKTLPVKKGEKLQFNACYQGVKSIMPYSYALLRMQTPGQKNYPAFTFYPGINGGQRLQQLLPTPPDTWERKFTQRRADEKSVSFQPTLIIAGHASEAVWDDFYIEDDDISAQHWTKTLNARPVANREKAMISKEKLAELIEKMPDRSAKVVSINGRSRLVLDGKIVAPVICGAPRSADHFGNSGVNLVRVGIRLGQGKNAKTYPGCWKSKDEVNIDQAVDQISDVLRLNPEARIILSILLHPYWEFTKDYPSEAWIGKKRFPAFRQRNPPARK